MIAASEILQHANAVGLRPNVVEKDYVLGWLLHAINQDPVLAGHWVFKGGTCLKKCYFETYRFSEDLDFTCLREEQLDQRLLLERFSAIGGWLEAEAGIEIPIAALRFELWRTKRGRQAGQGRVAYRGPVSPRGGDLPRIKIDLTADEVLVRPPAQMPVAHPYSDVPRAGMTATCYAFAEVFGEKVRALGERARPRDLYDVVNLHRNGAHLVTAAVVRDVLREKCRHKDIPEPTLEGMAAFREELAGDWKAMLAHQLPALPPVSAFWDVLPAFFDWLTDRGDLRPAAAERLHANDDDLVLQDPRGASTVPRTIAAMLENIRFAGANRLLVELDYLATTGARETRRIEPYSLRRTKTGDVVLHALRADTHEHRSYRLDRIRGVRILNEAFQPRYQIELTPQDSQPVLPRR